jgi:4-hydroxythreonine-4-phosphate dehydrogenase
VRLPPRLVVTSGEPAGIGPDLCIALAERDWSCQLIVAADGDLLAERARVLGSSVQLDAYDPSGPRATHRTGRLQVLHRPLGAPVRCGKLDPANARYVLDLLDTASDGCVRGEFDAMVTAPVQKSIVADAGIPFSGHTEYLAARTGCDLPVMLLASSAMRVALATTHLSLADVPGALTQSLIAQVVRIVDRDLRHRFGIHAPRILVCGLNPHAGESGHLGSEEIDIIAPAIHELSAAGIDVRGPAPADTAFTPHMLQDADVVLAMYHDQGLPVIKYASFGRAVNVTLGLPIIRTSVDHGTALSLAGSGKADSSSLHAAIELAIELTGHARDTSP